MRDHLITTPVGRRPMTLALVQRQLDTQHIESGKTAEKWKVFRDVCEARSLLGIPDRALTVLDALLTFYPNNELSEARGLVVFPSNIQLAVRSHGMAGTTLRRHLAALVEAGLVIRKDSPNGKRYARKDNTGEIAQAFGFSLAPMLARAEEFAQLAQQVVAARREFLIVKETLSLRRRDLRKLITVAMDEGAAGDWQSIEQRYVQIVARIPRSPATRDMEPILAEMTQLHAEVTKQLEKQINSKKTDTNAVHFGQHIHNSNTQSSHELEHGIETPPRVASGSQKIRTNERPISFPLGMVLKACPDIASYASGGAISNWRDLMSAAVVVRSMLGVSPSAYQQACEVMGPENTAVAMSCILERAAHISSAGGYLRDLTARAQRGEFSIGPMLMALLRVNSGSAMRVV